MDNKIVEKKLSNGATVYLYQDQTKHVTHVSLGVRMGGIDRGFILDQKEHQIPDGVAHFLEHLLIEHSSYGNLLHVFAEKNLSSNGGTGSLYTRYYFSGVTHITEGIDILIKAISIPYFTEEDICKTKPAIIEEIRGCNDSKMRRLSNLVTENLFQKIPFVSVIGTEKEIESITYELAKACYDAYYRPSNQILFIAGNFDMDEVLDTIENAYASIPEPTTSWEKISIEEPLEVKKKKGLIQMPSGTNTVQVSYKVSIKNHSPIELLKLDFYMSYFLRMNFGVTSKIYNDLLTSGTITDGIGFVHYKLGDFLIIDIQAHTEEEEIFTNAVESVMKTPIYDEDLFDLNKRQEKIDIAVRPEKLGSIIHPFLENLLSLGYPYLDTVEDVEAETFSEFKEMIQNLDFSNNTICIIEKEEEKK